MTLLPYSTVLYGTLSSRLLGPVSLCFGRVIQRNFKTLRRFLHVLFNSNNNSLTKHNFEGRFGKYDAMGCLETITSTYYASNETILFFEYYASKGSETKIFAPLIFTHIVFIATIAHKSYNHPKCANCELTSVEKRKITLRHRLSVEYLKLFEKQSSYLFIEN